jgi:short subunit dehydrogenase-like uncharacterized protein
VAAYDESVASFIAPFGMAPINTRIVRRTVGLMEAAEPSRAAQLFDPAYSYREVCLAPSEEMATKMARAATAPVDVRKKLVDQKRLPSPGEGPSAEERAKSWFKFTLVAESSDGDRAKRLACTVSGGDPGYDETAKMVSEAAVTLATEPRATLPASAAGGGFLTPATALGDVLRERLHAEGIVFEPAAVPGQTAQKSKL